VSQKNGRLPAGWLEVDLGDLMAATPNIVPADFPDTEFELWSVPAFDSAIPERQYGREIGSNKQAVEPGDVLLCKINPRINRVWKVADQADRPQIASTEWIVLRTGDIDPDFVLYRLREQSIRDFLCANVSGVGGSLTRVRPATVRNVTVGIPPLPEQRRIVARIEELQARTHRAREALEAIPPLLERFRQSVLAAAFRGDLTAHWRAQNPDVEPASALLERIRAERQGNRKKAVRSAVAEMYSQAFSELPAGWELVRLGDIVRLQAGYAFKSSGFSSDGVRLLRGTNIEPGATRWNDVVHLPQEQMREFNEYVLQEGDIVIAMDRPLISTGLKIARISEADLPALLLQRVGRFHLYGDIAPTLILAYLQSPIFLDHIQQRATGTQLPHISANDIESAPFPLPPADEQSEVAERCAAALGLVTQVSELTFAMLASCGRLDQSILAKAFRGELVLQDPNDEPASVPLERIRQERSQAQPKRGRRART
jgi:type I restriction enzyme, S subunit